MTNNYFVVPGFRIVPPSPDASPDAGLSDDALQRKVERIVARKPLPVDWARYFFFDDEDPVSTLRAYDAARRVSADFGAWRAPRCPGPWSAPRLIGAFACEVPS